MTATLAQAAARHKAHLELGGRHLKTVLGYKYRWAAFGKFIEGKEGREALVTDCTRENFFEFFLTRYSDLKYGSYMQYRNEMQAMSKFLMESGFVPYGPPLESMIPIRLPETDDRPEKILSDPEFILLQQEAWKSHPRDFFFYWLLRLTGRRAGEALKIRWKDISWREECVYWDNAKARKYGQQMPLTKPLRLMLEAWQDYYQWDVSEASLVPVPINPKWYVFPACTPTDAPRKGRRRNRRLNPTNFHTKAYDTVHLLLERAGLYEEGMGHHALRRKLVSTVKHVAQEAGRGDMWEMARLAADHEKIETTKRYVSERDDYNAFASFMHEFAMKLISPELIEATSFLRGQAEPPAERPQLLDELTADSLSTYSQPFTEADELLAEMDGVLAPRRAKKPQIRR